MCSLAEEIESSEHPREKGKRERLCIQCVGFVCTLSRAQECVCVYIFSSELNVVEREDPGSRLQLMLFTFTSDELHVCMYNLAGTLDYLVVSTG